MKVMTMVMSMVISGLQHPAAPGADIRNFAHRVTSCEGRADGWVAVEGTHVVKPTHFGGYKLMSWVLPPKWLVNGMDGYKPSHEHEHFIIENDAYAHSQTCVDAHYWL